MLETSSLLVSRSMVKRVVAVVLLAVLKLLGKYAEYLIAFDIISKIIINKAYTR